jgi:hypothetical protein
MMLLMVDGGERRNRCVVVVAVVLWAAEHSSFSKARHLLLEPHQWRSVDLKEMCA